jgi:hypothetical protein
MRRGFGLIGLVLTVVVIAVVGVIGYQAGWSEGFAQHVPNGAAAAPAPYPYYGGFYGPHFFGFGWIFGLLFFLFILFVFFRIARFAMWGGRGYGRGWGHQGGGVPPAMDERMREWHSKAHGEQPSTPAPGASPPPPPPPDQRSV